MIGNFLKGIGTYPRAHRAIARHRLWPWMLVPGFLGLTYMVLLSVAGFRVLPEWSASLYGALPSFLQWRGVEGIVTALLWFGLAVTAVFTAQPLALVMCSPVLSLMSEITERRVFGGEAPVTTLRSLARDVIRTIRVNARILARMVFFMLLAWTLVLVPLAGAGISAVTFFLIQSYYNGFMLTDYTLERKRLSIAESVAFIRRNRARTIGVGAGYFALMLVPILGWFLAPAYGTVAATLSALDMMPPGEAGPLPPDTGIPASDAHETN